jgi:hypothetical protein
MCFALVVATASVAAAGQAAPHSARSERSRTGEVLKSLPLRTPAGRSVGRVVFRRPTASERDDTGYMDADVTVVTPGRRWERLLIRGGTCHRILPVRGWHVWSSLAPVGGEVLALAWSALQGRRWAVETFTHYLDIQPSACADNAGATTLIFRTYAWGAPPIFSPSVSTPPPRRVRGNGIHVSLVDDDGRPAGTATVTPGNGRSFTVAVEERPAIDLNQPGAHDGPAGDVRAGTCARLLVGDREITLYPVEGDGNGYVATGSTKIPLPLAPLLQTPHVIELYDDLQSARISACGVLSR